jgi:hypothetical protein
MRNESVIDLFITRQAKLQTLLAECEAAIAVNPDDQEIIAKALSAILDADAIDLVKPWLDLARTSIPGSVWRLRAEAALARSTGDFDLEAAYWERAAVIGQDYPAVRARIS